MKILICDEREIKIIFTLDGAAQFNNKIKNDIDFISRFPDADAVHTNFMTFKNFSKYVTWVFPPRPMRKLFLLKLLKTASTDTWAFAFHRYLEWPEFYPLLLLNPNIKLFNIGTREFPCTYFPSDKLSTIGGQPVYGKLNLISSEFWVAVHVPLNPTI